LDDGALAFLSFWSSLLICR